MFERSPASPTNVGLGSTTHGSIRAIRSLGAEQREATQGQRVSRGVYLPEGQGAATGDAIHAGSIADFMDRFNVSHCVVTYNQNLLFQNVRTEDLVLYELPNSRRRISMESPTRFAVLGDFATRLPPRPFRSPNRLRSGFRTRQREDIGQLHLNMSGQRQGHHHTGHILESTGGARMLPGQDRWPSRLQ